MNYRMEKEYDYISKNKQTNKTERKKEKTTTRYSIITNEQHYTSKALLNAAFLHLPSAVPTTVTTSTVTIDEDGLFKTTMTSVSSPSSTMYVTGLKFTNRAT